MKTIFPAPLVKGDHIRVISLSTSLGVVAKEVRQIAQAGFEKRGYRVTFGLNTFNHVMFQTASIQERLEDFEEALKDPDVSMILAGRGGFNINQLLPYLDFDLIAQARKIICGHSDITALVNAIWARTKFVTYLGPNFSTLGMKKGAEYSWDALFVALEQSVSFSLVASKRWSDDKWQKDQNKRIFLKNAGPFVIQPGKMEGIIIGGNLCTLNLLQGTPNMPSLEGSVLFIEDDDLVGSKFAQEFDRNLESLLQQKDASKICGIVFGRFQKASCMTRKKLIEIVRVKKILRALPIVAGVDFGHTAPQCTLPIGSRVKVIATHGKVSIDIQQTFR